MSFLSKFCGCFAVDRSPHRLSCPYEYPIENIGNGYPRRAVGQNTNNDNGADGNYSSDIEGSMYSPTVPLPRYTPHPSVMNEKTLAFERPARSSWTSLSESRNQTNTFAADEKNPNEFRISSEGPRHHGSHGNSNGQNSDDSNSDASSTLSYPSSYGNTSTATASPPPPYSSPPPAGSIMSQRTEEGRYSQDTSPSPTSPPVIHIPQPQPVLQRAQFLYQVNDGRERRRSGEGRNSVSLPPIYQRRDGM